MQWRDYHYPFIRQSNVFSHTLAAELCELVQASSGVPAISESSYKGQKCVKFAVREYKNLPCCVNPLQVAPVIDILSRDGNFVSFFKLPRPVVVSNETTFFVNLVDCLQFLSCKHLALESIGLEVFCQGDEEQSCKLSPYCQPVSDPSGSLLVNNMREIASLRLFQRERILDSLRTAKSIHDLKGHPATWSSLEDVSFLFHYSAFASPNNSNFKLDHLIMTRNENGQVDWANEPLINNDIKGRTYKRNCFQNLLDMRATKWRTLENVTKNSVNSLTLPLMESLDTLIRKLLSTVI